MKMDIPDFDCSGLGKDSEDNSHWSWHQRLELEVDTESDTGQRCSVEASQGALSEA